jgi:hypothetical protein
VTRVKEFVLRVPVSDEAARNPAFAAQARESLRRAVPDLSGHLSGPRGGRYEAVSEPYDFAEGYLDDDYSRGMYSFTARVRARYVRPRR